ncbi:MAG: 16S rRNA (cytosine(1402)-N(4))-methyltransferase [Lachnoclostridium sp.]
MKILHLIWKSADSVSRGRRYGFEHRSVLLEETVNGLNIKPDGIYVNGTLGGGGHAFEVCTRLNDKGSIVGIDQDEAAIEAAGIRLKTSAIRLQ